MKMLGTSFLMTMFDIRDEALNPIRRILGRMISGNIDGAIEYIRSLANGPSIGQGKIAFLLRLSAHLVLVMRDLEIPHNQDLANEIIKEYIHALMEFHVVHSHID